MLRFTPDRRTFLKAAGVCMALPMFESLPRLGAAGKKTEAPRRMVCIGNEFGLYPGASGRNPLEPTTN